MNYYPHHIGDFRSGTFNMTREERWIYRDMIDVYYDTESPFPDNLEIICKMVGIRTTEEKEIVAEILLLKFELKEDGYHHERCDLEIIAYRSKSDNAKNNGKKGGRPTKNNPEKPSGLFMGSDLVSDRNQEITESKANQEPITNNQEPITNKKKKSATSAEVDFYDVPEKIVDDFKAHRKLKKAAITQTAVNRIKTESEKAGISLADALTLCCSRGWIGFEASWIFKDEPRARGAPYQSKSEQTQDWVNKLIGKSQNGNSEIVDIN